MHKIADNSLQETPTVDLQGSPQQLSKPLISNTVDVLLALLFIWFIAPLLGGGILLCVLGTLLLSMNVLQCFGAPLDIALLTSLLVTAATIKVVYKLVKRSVR